jgi:hypothetical protein
VSGLRYRAWCEGFLCQKAQHFDANSDTMSTGAATFLGLRCGHILRVGLQVKNLDRCGLVLMSLVKFWVFYLLCLSFM